VLGLCSERSSCPCAGEGSTSSYAARRCVRVGLLGATCERGHQDCAVWQLCRAVLCLEGLLASPLQPVRSWAPSTNALPLDCCTGALACSFKPAKLRLGPWKSLRRGTANCAGSCLNSRWLDAQAARLLGQAPWLQQAPWPAGERVHP
jgi:hypothetical protein